MESIKPIKSAFVKITPELAQHWIATRGYYGQRDLKPKRVNLLADAMRDGSFMPTNQITFVLKDGTYELTNGNHTLHAIVKSGMPQELNVVEILGLTADSTSQMYVNTDTHTGRGPSDYVRPYRLQEETGLSKNQLNQLGSAVKLIRAGFRRDSTYQVRVPAELYLDGIREYAPFAKAFLQVATDIPSEMHSAVFRAATYGVALITFRYSVEVYDRTLIENFWRGVVTGLDLHNGDPRYVAYRHLLLVAMKNGETTGTRKRRKMSVEQSTRVIAHCFNKHVLGLPLSIGRAPAADSPLIILGSPYDGKYTGRDEPELQIEQPVFY